MQNIPDWQLITPFKYDHSQFQVKHLLTCGSYTTTKTVQGLEVCSIYNIKKHMAFPILKEASRPGQQTVLITTHGSMKVDERIQKQWQVSIDPTDIRGDEVSDSQFIRMIVQSKSKRNSQESPVGVLYENQQIRLKRLALNYNQEFVVNDSRTFLLILSGQVRLLKDFEPVISQNEAVYLTKGAIRATKSSIVVVLSWLC